MNTEERPETSMAKKMERRWSGGKFLARLVADQSSRNRDARRRIGIVKRLL